MRRKSTQEAIQAFPCYLGYDSAIADKNLCKAAKIDPASYSQGPSIIINQLGGNCPVQAEGTINGQPFYFRARYDRWNLGIGGEPVCDPVWSYEERYGTKDGFDASWMSQENARQFIEKAAGIYHKTPIVEGRKYALEGTL